LATLHLVATPIGNLEDVTLRALRVLREAELVLAEDTRHTRVLLDRHGTLRSRLAARAQRGAAQRSRVRSVSRAARVSR
jgi:16S rRNA (cytidine1402-2'-O)-methyltransferase